MPAPAMTTGGLVAAGPGCEPVGWATGTVAFLGGKVGAGLSLGAG